MVLTALPAWRIVATRSPGILSRNQIGYGCQAMRSGPLIRRLAASGCAAKFKSGLNRTAAVAQTSALYESVSCPEIVAQAVIEFEDETIRCGTVRVQLKKWCGPRRRKVPLPPGRFTRRSIAPPRTRRRPFSKARVRPTVGLKTVSASWSSFGPQAKVEG